MQHATKARIQKCSHAISSSELEDNQSIKLKQLLKDQLHAKFYFVAQISYQEQITLQIHPDHQTYEDGKLKKIVFEVHAINHLLLLWTSD